MNRVGVTNWMRCMTCILCCLAAITGIAAQRGPLAKQFRSYDRDGSGEVTAEELTDPMTFKLLDSNGDGAITLKETRAAVAAGRLRGVKLPPPATAKQATLPVEVASWSDEVRQGPKPIKAGEAGVGRRIDDLEFVDIDGDRHRLSDYRDSKAVVIAMTGTGCPLCLKYAPTLAAIEERYRDKQVSFIWVNPNESESLKRLGKAIQAQGFEGPYVRDIDERLTRSLDVHTTTEVFVVDRARTLCYRGAVDDQYGFGYSLEHPKRNYLTDALDAVVAGQRPLVAATTSPGCEMFYRQDVATDSTIANATTYHNRISRILLDHCVGCHREGGSAPFALQDFESARDYSEMIGSVVRRGIMPPWFAAAHDAAGNVSGDSTSGDAGLKIHWANDRSLSEADRKDLLAWVDAGAAEGNRDDGPLPRSYPDEWEIGEPDLVLQIPKPFSVKAVGRMPYKHARIETELSEDRWVKAVEIRPTDASVVHHVLVFVQEPGNEGKDGIDEEAGFFAAYVPGNTFQIYPEGFAKKIPAGSKLVCQLHYTPNGTATSDQTRVGIQFAAEPPMRMIRNAGIANHRIEIPPMASNHRETASLKVPSDVRLLSFMPHMHLRGKAFRYDVVFPDGRRELLLDVPRYDFNWQLEYRLSEPLDVPRDSRIEVSGWYDNSDKNPANPDATATVKWGPQTEDEMMLGYVEYVLRDEVID